jgi:hypothetical protein
MSEKSPCRTCALSGLVLDDALCPERALDPDRFRIADDAPGMLPNPRFVIRQGNRSGPTSSLSGEPYQRFRIEYT